MTHYTVACGQFIRPLRENHVSMCLKTCGQIPQKSQIWRFPDFSGYPKKITEYGMELSVLRWFFGGIPRFLYVSDDGLHKPTIFGIPPFMETPLWWGHPYDWLVDLDRRGQSSDRKISFMVKVGLSWSFLQASFLFPSTNRFMYICMYTYISTTWLDIDKVGDLYPLISFSMANSQILLLLYPTLAAGKLSQDS